MTEKFRTLWKNSEALAESDGGKNRAITTFWQSAYSTFMRWEKHIIAINNFLSTEKSYHEALNDKSRKGWMNTYRNKEGELQRQAVEDERVFRTDVESMIERLDALKGVKDN